MFRVSLICLMGIGYFIITNGSRNGSSYSFHMNQALLASGLKSKTL